MDYEFLASIVLLSLLLTGFVVGALTRQPEVRELLTLVRKQHDNFLHVMDLYTEQSAVNARLREVNHGLGQALQNAGIQVRLIGHDNQPLTQEAEFEWPEEL